MGKKKSGNSGCSVGVDKVAAREFSLKVAMHCKCHGCTDRLRAAVRDLTLAPGVEAVDQSAAEATGEVRVLATADPERLRKGLRKATGKKVDLVFPPSKERRKGEEDARAVDAAAVQALLADLQLHHQYGGQAAVRQYGGQGAAAAWAASQQHQQQLLGLGGGWNGSAGAGGYGAAYPWQPSSAASYYSGAPAAGAGWGAYSGYGYAPAAQAPAQGHAGYYGASSPAWHGQGY